jgi:hypothetical protein
LISTGVSSLSAALSCSTIRFAPSRSCSIPFLPACQSLIDQLRCSADCSEHSLLELRLVDAGDVEVLQY